jgi:hypothetical protein
MKSIGIAASSISSVWVEDHTGVLALRCTKKISLGIKRRALKVYLHSV